MLPGAPGIGSKSLTVLPIGAAAIGWAVAEAASLSSVLLMLWVVKLKASARSAALTLPKVVR